jgi:hypothetical protein
MNNKRRTRLLKICFTVLFLLLSFYPILNLTAQSANIIALQPTSGPPGTTIVVLDSSGTNRGKNCGVSSGSASPQSIGVMQGSISYVVPSAVAAGTSLSFICTGGADGMRTNTATFTVTTLAIIVQPPGQPADSDGDGLPDTRDNCPTVAGSLENGGCPLSAPPAADADGDGLPDSADVCPNETGVPENNGCPIVPTAVPEVVLPPLPADGVCSLATLDAAPVNVRQLPSTDSAIVGSLDPLSIYPVIGRNADNSWLQISSGWVAAFVARQGGDCTAVPQADGTSNTFLAGEIIPAQIGLLVPAVQKVREASARLQNCPALFPTVDGLPTFLTLYIVGEPDPCAFAEAELGDLFLAAQPDPMASLEGDYLEWVNNLCPDQLGSIYDFVSLLNRIQNRSPEVWQDVLSRISEANICLVVQEFAEQGYLNPFVFLDEQINLIGVAYCTAEAYKSMSPGWVSRVEGFISFLQVPTLFMRTLVNLNGGACDLIEHIRPIGFISTGNALFYSTLANSCGINNASAAERALLNSIRGAYDAGAAANMGCAGYDQYTTLPLSPDLQPTMPTIAQDADCQGNFRLLATHNEGLSPETLFRVLTALHPCDSAYEMAYYGGIAYPNQLPLPACFQNGQVIIAAPSLGQSDVLLTNASTWRQKLLILDRPLDQICNYLDLSVGTDGFALVPTEDALDLVIVPSATPLGFVVAPTATLPVIVDDQGLLPTAPPLLDSSPTPPVPTLQPADPLPAVNPPPGDQAGGNHYQIISAGRIIDPLTATFVAYDPQGNFQGRYVLTGIQHWSKLDRSQLLSLPPECCPGMRTDLPLSILPGGEAFTYFANDPTDGTVNLWVFGSELPADQPAIRLGTFVPDVTYSPAWSPDGQFVAIAGSNSGLEGQQTLVFYLGGSAAPILTIDNATAPSISPNGRLLAFERLDPTGRNIYVLATNSGEIIPITQQPAGTACYQPQFGLDSLNLFFTCETNGERGIFRYGLAGLIPLQTGVANVQNPAPGPEAGYITFDDGQTVYISREDGTNAVPLVQIDGLRTRGFEWTQPPGVPDSIWLDLSTPVQ